MSKNTDIPNYKHKYKQIVTQSNEMKVIGTYRKEIKYPFFVLTIIHAKASY